VSDSQQKTGLEFDVTVEIPKGVSTSSMGFRPTVSKPRRNASVPNSAPANLFDARMVRNRLDAGLAPHRGARCGNSA
jgi:hypothetical protein